MNQEWTFLFSAIVLVLVALMLPTIFRKIFRMYFAEKSIHELFKRRVINEAIGTKGESPRADQAGSTGKPEK